MITTWETESLPSEFVTLLNRVRQVWVPSTYNKSVFQKALSAPVNVVPHPVREFYVAAGRSAVEEVTGIRPDDFVFAAVATGQDRKNLLNIIRAFGIAFRGRKDVLLVIKTRFGFVRERSVREQILEVTHSSGIGRTPRTLIIADEWTEGMVDALIDRCNCYVSLHRAEGWCYPLFDAACRGKPIVATGYSGPMDYLDDVHHCLVHYQLVSIEQRDTQFAFSSDMRWAEPDVMEAASLMEYVYQNKVEVQMKAMEAASIIKQRFALERIGSIARKHLVEGLSDSYASSTEN